MKHHATMPKKKLGEILIKDLEEKDTTKNNAIIGRRTGKNIGDHIANGNDFLLKNDFTDILERQQKDMYDLYSSDSDSSSSGEESSSSESEAEESERENSLNNNTANTKKESNQIFQKRINPTIVSNKENNSSNVVVNLNEKKIYDNTNFEEKYKSLASRIMRDSPLYDIPDEDVINQKNKSESDSSVSESEDEASSPDFNKNVINKNNQANQNLINTNNKSNMTNKTSNLNNKVVPQVNKNITAKNNFKSDKKELWSEKDKVKIEVEEEDDIDLSFTSEVKVKYLKFI
jgi:hypothetical protein